jgi:hypothetical protein
MEILAFVPGTMRFVFGLSVPVKASNLEDKPKAAGVLGWRGLRAVRGML